MAASITRVGHVKPPVRGARVTDPRLGAFARRVWETHLEQQLAQLLAQVGVSWDALLTRVQSPPQQMLAHGAIGLAFLLTLAGAYARTMRLRGWRSVWRHSLRVSVLAPSHAAHRARSVMRPHTVCAAPACRPTAGVLVQPQA